MSHIGKNIKKIRASKKLSQAQFAKFFNLARPSVGAYEEGRSEPKIDTIIQIAKKYRLSIDLLLTKELTINELFRFDIFNKNLDRKSIPWLKEIKRPPGIPLVRISQQLEYLVKHENKDFLDQLDTIEIPGLKPSNSRAFEMSGHEMEYHHNGIHHGDLLVAGKIVKIQKSKLSPEKIYITITPQSILVGRLKDSPNSLIFQADDPHYEDRTYNLKDLLELWEVIGVYSTQLQPPQMIEERMMTLENQLTIMQQKIKSFKG